VTDGKAVGTYLEHKWLYRFGCENPSCTNVSTFAYFSHPKR